MKRLAAGVLSFGFVLGGCGSASNPATVALPFGAHAADRASPLRGSPIRHVVVIVQENRSVDDLFHRFPGANTVDHGLDSRGKMVPLEAEPLDSSFDVLHTHGAFEVEYDDGKIDGFDKVYVQGNGHSGEGKFFAYAYVPQDQVVPYW